VQALVLECVRTALARYEQQVAERTDLLTQVSLFVIKWKDIVLMGWNCGGGTPNGVSGIARGAFVKIAGPLTSPLAVLSGTGKGAGAGRGGGAAGGAPT
jgi:hypothetical protein